MNGKSYLALDAKQSETYHPWTKPLNEPTLPCGPEILEVKPDKTYRFRVIGGSALSLVAFAFEDHDNLTVIAADGRYTQPAPTERVQVGPGQRFEFLLKTKSVDELSQLGKSLFWIQFEIRSRPINETSYAVLKYTCEHNFKSTVPASPPARKPVHISFDYQNWLEHTLQSLQSTNLPSGDQVSRRVYLHNAQLAASDMGFWTVNNRTWNETNEHLGDTAFNSTNAITGTPYLVNIYKEGEAAIPNYARAVDYYGGWDPKLNVYAAKVGEVIDIILVNEPNGLVGGFDSHPWHIHGGHAYDLGSGNGPYDPAAHEQKLRGYNPTLRDTVYLYRYTLGDGLTLPPYSGQGWRALRLKVHDPG